MQQPQQVVGGVRLTQARENLLDAMPVRAAVAVGHGIDDEHNLVAVTVSAAGGRFHAGAGRYTRQEDLG